MACEDLKRGNLEVDMYTGRMPREAEAFVTKKKKKKKKKIHPKSSADQQKLGDRYKIDFLPQRHRESILPDALVLGFWSPELREYTSAILSHLAFVLC